MSGGRRPSVLVLSMLALAGTIGCGGDRDPEAAPGPGAGSPTSAPGAGAGEPGFRLVADRLCARAQAQQEVIRRERGGDQITLSDRARLLVDLAPPRIALGEQLAELEPPPGERRRAAELVAAAERRGIASAEAGQLWEQGAGRERLAAAAAREHDQRELFVELAAGFGLRECAERLPRPAIEEITAAIEGGFAEQESERCEALGSRLLEELAGGGAGACAASGPPLPASRTVSVDDLQGMAGVFAVARVSAGAGAGRESYRLRIVHEQGAYRIDKVD